MTLNEVIAELQNIVEANPENGKIEVKIVTEIKEFGYSIYLGMPEDFFV